MGTPVKKAYTSMTCGLKIQGKANIGTKGQIVIPKEVRDLLKLKPGDDLIVFTKNNMAIGLVKADDLDHVMQYMQQEKK